MTVTKKTLVAQLKEAANLLEVLNDDPFRAKAYGNAARSLDAFEGDVETLFAEERLTEIRGVGRGLAGELYALKEHDHLPLLDELYTRVPEGVRRLFVVSGLGAKKIAVLWENGIEDLEGLLAAAEDGRVASLKGFGKKSAASLAEGARFALAAMQRYRLDVAERYAEVLAEALAIALRNARVLAAGDLRRGLETVGVLELVVVGAPADEVAAAIEPLVHEVTVEGEVISARLEARGLRLTVTDEDALGAVLALRTGGDAYREELVKRASERGFDLREDGLFREGKRLPTPDEADLFAMLDLSYTPPERREAARPVPVNHLVTLADVKGVIHNHSSWSDGAASLREMVAAARALGYRYLAMADHSRSSYYAGGLSIERVYKQAEEVAEIREELKGEEGDFEVLHGLEVDILSDGSLDYPDEVLALLDYAVVSVHQNFTLSEAEQTARIVRAVGSPFASILAHPTGRLLLRRPSYAVDLEAVLSACAEAGTVVEINANTRRLDLDWRWVVQAKELGCTFSIDPDAHHPDGYHDVRYGVLMARKAGLTPEDVVNTAPTASAFLERLKARPG